MRLLVRNLNRSLNTDNPDGVTSDAGLAGPAAGFIGFLRTVALVAAAVGGVGSAGLTLFVGQHNPSRFLLVLFTIWVLAPFVALLLTNLVSQHWPVITRLTLYCLTLVLTLVTLAAYGNVAWKPPEGQAAFSFVVFPLVSWLLIVTVVPIAALISRRLSGRADGA